MVVYVPRTRSVWLISLTRRDSQWTDYPKTTASSAYRTEKKRLHRTEQAGTLSHETKRRGGKRRNI